MLAIKRFEHRNVIGELIELPRIGQVPFQLTKQRVEVCAFIGVRQAQLAMRAQAVADGLQRGFWVGQQIKNVDEECVVRPQPMLRKKRENCRHIAFYKEDPARLREG